MKMDQSNNDDDYDYEETTVMVELQGIMENDFLSKVTQAKVLGLDTEKPLLQLDDYTFTGQYSDTMGTHLLFEDKTDHDESKPDEKKLEYSCLTNKKLCLQRVFLKNNDELTQADTSAGQMMNSKDSSKSDSKKTLESTTEAKSVSSDKEQQLENSQKISESGNSNKDISTNEKSTEEFEMMEGTEESGTKDFTEKELHIETNEKT